MNFIQRDNHRLSKSKTINDPIEQPKDFSLSTELDKMTIFDFAKTNNPINLKY